MKKIKVAVIGCGTIANLAHIPSYMRNDAVEIVYFCDIIPQRAQEAVAKYSCGTAVTDYREVLGDPAIDAVSVCVPNHMHAPITIDFLRAGKHVLCEKPAAANLEDAKKMQAAQHESGKSLFIGVVNRFNASVNKIKELIEAGELGEVYHVFASFRAHRSIPGLGGDFTRIDRAGGGVLIDWGVHYLDIVMYCCGDPKPLTVSGETFSKLGKNIPGYDFVGMWAGPPDLEGVYDVEDSVTGIVRTDGPVISIHGAWAQNIGEDETHIDFMGDKAGIRLQYGAGFTLYGTKNKMLTQTKMQFTMNDQFQSEIDAFVESVQTGKPLPSNIDTVILTAKIMQSIYDSARNHAEVKVADNSEYA